MLAPASSSDGIWSLLAILRRRFSSLLNHIRILTSSRFLLDIDHLHFELMAVAVVEQVEKLMLPQQSQVPNNRLVRERRIVPLIWAGDGVAPVMELVVQEKRTVKAGSFARTIIWSNPS